MTKRNLQIKETRNYRMFRLSEENRSLDLKKHKNLKESMQKYGFLRCFPLACYQNGQPGLILKDGQHRLAIAEELGLPVFYTVETTNFDVAFVNCTPKPWTLRDYAQKYAANGLLQYQVGLDFAERHSLPLGTAFALLAGVTAFTNCPGFHDGTFEIRDQEWADKVASTYSTLVAMSKKLKTARFIEAVMACCRVDEFDPSRLIRGAERCRDRLVAYSTRDAYLEMLEEVYNFGRKELVALRINAIQAMKDRCVGSSKKDDDA